jgi:hypothetical protein
MLGVRATHIDLGADGTETAKADVDARLAIFIRWFAVSMYNVAWPEDGKVKPLTTRSRTRTRPERTETHETFHLNRSTPLDRKKFSSYPAYA